MYGKKLLQTNYFSIYLLRSRLETIRIIRIFYMLFSKI